MTLFELMVVNNWTITCDGFVAASESKLTRVFFVLFHIVCVVIINNLVISFVVEAFMTEYNAVGARSNKTKNKTTDRGVTVSRQQATFDATLIAGTQSGVKGMYVARVGKRGVGNRRKSSFLMNIFASSPDRKGGGMPRSPSTVEEGDEDI